MIGHGGEIQRLYGDLIYSYYVSEVFTGTRGISGTACQVDGKSLWILLPLHIGVVPKRSPNLRRPISKHVFPKIAAI